MNSSIHPNNKVLLICPVRNEAAFIPRLLLSLQQQSHSNWNILFFDNASTDDTAQIISQASINDNRIILKIFKTPVPINENFNRAIQRTLTNYKGFDPEVSVNGIDLNVYPVTRTFSAGVNLIF